MAAQEPPTLGGDVVPELLAILAGPLDKQPVAREGNYLVCSECQRHQITFTSKLTERSFGAGRPFAATRGATSTACS